MWYVYILRCSDNSLYTGISTDPAKRLLFHNKGKASKYTRSRRPVELVYCEKTTSKSKALKREIKIKDLSAENKHKLVKSIPVAEKNYRLIEHTADIGIKVEAKTIKSLFKNSALAMFDIITTKKTHTNKTSLPKKLKIKQSADDLKELFINWLNELLSLSSAKGLIFSDFRIGKLGNNNLEAEVFAVTINNYKVNTEIKAATYHQLKLEQTKKGWLAEVIFDV